MGQCRSGELARPDTALSRVLSLSSNKLGEIDRTDTLLSHGARAGGSCVAGVIAIQAAEAARRETVGRRVGRFRVIVGGQGAGS